MVNSVALILSVILVTFFVFVMSTSSAPEVFEAPPVQDVQVTQTPQFAADVALDPVQPPYGTGAMDTFDTSMESGAQALGATVLAHYMAQSQNDPIELECPQMDVPCPQEVVWRNTFPGCGSFFIPIEGKDYFRDDRLWQGDLNPKIQERYAVMEKQWDPYQYMNSRQAWTQFIATNNSAQSDKYMRAIDDLTDVDTTRVTDIEPVPVY